MEKFTLVNTTLGIIGKRNSGKSYVLKHILLYEAHLFSKILVCSSTESVNRFYSDIIPHKHIYDSYTEEFGEKLINGLTRENSNKPKEEQKKVLLILDDLVGSTNFHSSKTIAKMVSMGRHISLSLCVVSQYLNALSPIIRNNLDFLLIGQQNHSSVVLLRDQFQSGNITRQEFIDMYYRCTVDFNFLVVNCNTVKDDNLNSLYGKIKCPSEEMDKKIEKIKMVEDEEPTKKEGTMWGSIFGEEIKVKPRERNTIKQQIKCVKPIINPAFDLAVN